MQAISSEQIRPSIRKVIPCISKGVRNKTDISTNETMHSKAKSKLGRTAVIRHTLRKYKETKWNKVNVFDTELVYTVLI